MNGKRVLITGGANGIGLCIATEFAEAGAELVLTDIDEGALQRAAEGLRAEKGAVVHTRRCDVANQEQVEAVAHWIIDDLGGLDVLINNAGVGHQGELADTTLETWRKLIDVNFWGPLHHVYAFLPHMRQRGGCQIVNVSSGQAFFRLPTWGAYTAAKAALAAFSEVLHFELRPSNIDVTTVYPFLVNTGFYDGVEGETLGARLSMKLMPLYSMKPDTVGRVIYRAVVSRKRVEMVTILNDLGQLASVAPLLPRVMGVLGNWVLAKKAQGGPAAAA